MIQLSAFQYIKQTSQAETPFSFFLPPGYLLYFCKSMFNLGQLNLLALSTYQVYFSFFFFKRKTFVDDNSLLNQRGSFLIKTDDGRDH